MCQYFDDSWTPPKAHHVTAKNVTTMLHAGIHLVLADGVQLDITPDEVSARSPRAGGATALLCANVNPNVIQLLGQWKFNAMIRYLHVLAQPVIGKYATRMSHRGNFTFGPGNQLLPDFAMYVAPEPKDLNELQHVSPATFLFSLPLTLMALGGAGELCTRMDRVGQSSKCHPNQFLASRPPARSMLDA